MKQYDLIIINAGHGGPDPGAVSEGVKEKDITLRWALLLAKLLRRNGCEVYLTRDSDTFDSLATISDKANKRGTRNSLFLSLHNNKFGKSSANGLENFVHPSASQSTIDLASALAVELVKAAPVLAPLRVGSNGVPGVKTANFSVLRRAQMPAILMEIGFLSNPPEREFVSNPENDDLIVETIARVICNGQALGLPVIERHEEDDFDECDYEALSENLDHMEWWLKKSRKEIESK